MKVSTTTHTTTTLTDDKGNSFPLTFSEPVEDSVQVSIIGDTATVGYLVQQCDGSDNPRDWDNLGTMTCFHDRYTLGDEHSFSDPEDLLTSLARAVEPIALDSLERSEASDEELRAFILKTVSENYVVLPLGFYDHSGITMYVGSRHGQVGETYVSLARAQAETNADVSLGWDAPVTWGKEKLTLREYATKVLEGEVETYDLYLTGEVYMQVMETFTLNGAEWEPRDYDCCGGYFGYEEAKKELESAMAL